MLDDEAVTDAISSIQDKLNTLRQERYNENVQMFIPNGMPADQLNNWIADTINILEHIFIVMNMEAIAVPDDIDFVSITPRREDNV